MGRRLSAALVAICLLGGCGSTRTATTPAGSAEGVAGPPASLTGNELLYGATPHDDGTVIYQPDVVILGGGADSIKSVSSDGLIWTVDATAAHADEIVPGKILFATSLGAGRVLAVAEDGTDKRVALGPIAITDLIRDGELRSDSPVSVEDYLAYTTPDRPGLQGDDDEAGGPDGAETAPDTTGGPSPTGPPDEQTPSTVAGGISYTPDRTARPRVAFATFDSRARGAGPLAPPSPKLPSGTVAGWRYTSICCTSNGVHVTWDGGARIQATAQFKFTQPTVSFHLKIGGGSVIDAGVRLNGAASLSFGISAAIQASSDNLRSGRVQLPVSINIPIPIGGIPINISFEQIFTINLGLSGAAQLSTEGEYALGGTLGFSLRDGSPTVETPTLTTVKSALDNISSVAVAPQGLTIAYAMKTSIGVGVPGLNAGLWFQMSAALSLATSGSQIDPLQGTSLVTCKTVALSVLARYGVGYSIPNFVAKAINLFLGLIMKIASPVKPTGGPAFGPTTLFEKKTPPCSKGRGS